MRVIRYGLLQMDYDEKNIISFHEYMKIALVLCPSWTIESPSYTLALLSANLKKYGHEVKCFDLNIEMRKACVDKAEIETWQMDEKGSVWYEEKYVLNFMQRHYEHVDNLVNEILSYEPDIIGFTVYSTSRHFSYELAKKIKEKDSKRIIIFGGPQCFKNCEGIGILKRPYVDAVCFGEGDIALPKMITAISKNNGIVGPCSGFGVRDEKGAIVNGEEEGLVRDLNSLPYADYSDFNISDYAKKLLPISTSRGCLGKCKFCNESPHWKKYRFRSAENIYNEICYQLDKYPNVMEFWFNDSLINGNIKMLKDLCDLFIKNKLKIKYGGQALIRPEMDPDLLSKMKQSGCTLISYGLESGSSAVLKKMRKSYSAEIAEKVIRNTHKAGIGVIFNIIVGFPGEIDREVDETKIFIEKNSNYVKEISIMPLLLLKGSYLYKNAENIGVDLNTKCDQLRWKMLDNSNNYDIRMQRFKLLKEVTGKKAYVTHSGKSAKRSLNICLTSREYPIETGWGGIGTYTYHLAHALTERGHTVHVISQGLEKEQSYKDKDVNVHRIRHENYFYSRFIFEEFILRLEYSRVVSKKLNEIIGKYDIDIIEGPNLSAETFFYSFNRKTPVVTRLHTNFSGVLNFAGKSKGLDNKLSCWFEDSSVRRSDLIICSTKRHAKKIADETGISQDRIKIIPLGIKLPESHGLGHVGEKPYKVLFVGRLEERKGPQVLVKAIPLILRAVPDTEFIFIGRDTFSACNGTNIIKPEGCSCRELLMENIPEQCRPRVRFLGYVNNEKLAEYFRLCTIFAAPSLYESFGFIYIEAMSYGKPVIGCGVGGVPEVIKDGKTGVLVPPDDHVALANAIIDLLKNEGKRQEIGFAAREDVEINFTRGLMAERTEQAYASLLK